MQEGEIGDGAFDFDACASARRGTASVKWDTPSEEGVLPLWVADMDFRVAPAIVEALRRRVDDGVFGYALPPPAWHESLARWLSRRHGLTVAPDAILDATGVIPPFFARYADKTGRSSYRRPSTEVSSPRSATRGWRLLKVRFAAFPSGTPRTATSPTRWTSTTLSARSPSPA